MPTSLLIAPPRIWKPNGISVLQTLCQHCKKEILMTFYLPEMILAEIEAKFLFLNALDYYYFALLLKLML